MLTTGIRTPIGVKIFGTDLAEIAVIGEQLEAVLQKVPGTRSVYAEREMGGYFIDFIPDRAAIALSVPFAAVGAIWLMYALKYNTSIAVWVGTIALLGIAAQTASVMVFYLDEGFAAWSKDGRIRTVKDLIEMVVDHGGSRVRPLLMAVGLNIMGLFPIMLSTGVGSDVAQGIAAPLWGGLVSLTLLTLLVIPTVFVIWRSFGLRHSSSAAKEELGDESGKEPHDNEGHE